MPQELLMTLSLVLCYLIGSIPPAIWISKYVFGKDIRTQGSCNAGSTNMYRIYGRWAGISTQVIDVAKGSLAASIPLLLSLLTDAPLEQKYTWLTMEVQSLICGVVAVVGHVWPIFAGFKGGKGVNTLLGMMLVVNVQGALICLGVFLVLFLITHFVSVGSMAGTLAYPAFIILRSVLNGEEPDALLVGLGLFMFALVAYTHRTNIRRILSGNENKMYLLKGKK